MARRRIVSVNGVSEKPALSDGSAAVVAERTDAREPLRRIRLGILIVTLIAVAAFARVVTFDFAYDDQWTIRKNRWLERPLGEVLSAVAGGRANALGIPDATRPTMIVSTWLDRRLFANNPTGYHLHSLLLYAVVCVLAGLALLAISGRARVALAGVLFFTLAPIHAEVVAAINYREDILAAVGILVPLAWLFQRRSRPDPAPLSVLVALAWMVGLLGKESAVALVPILLALMLILGKQRNWILARERTLTALTAVLILWLNWRLAVRIGGDGVPLAPRNEAMTTLLMTARFEVLAVRDALIPVFWSPEHAWPRSASPLWALALVALTACLALPVWRRSLRTPAAGIAIALLAALPMSPLVGPANPQADRYAFMAVLGGALFWGWLVDRLITRMDRRLAIATTVALLIALAPLAMETQRALKPWQNDRSLWLAATARAPESPRAWQGLSRVHRIAGEIEAADQSLQRALHLNPDYLPAHLTRVYNLLARGEVQAAKKELDLIQELDGGNLRGVNRAARCARLAPQQAKLCIE